MVADSGSELRQRPEDQRLPRQGSGPFSHDVVISQLRHRYPNAVVLESMCIDVRGRQELGTRRYGYPLQAHNGRDVLLDLYEELLDAMAYGSTAIEEFGVSDRYRLSQLVRVFDMVMDAARIVKELRALPSPPKGEPGGVAG